MSEPVVSAGGGRRVVVTGFRRFPGVADNPSQALIEHLQGATGLLPAGAEFRLLETAYAAVSPALEAILADPPAALVLTGYSALARGFKVERRASDVCSPDFADASGFRPAPRPGAMVDLRESGCDFAALEAALLTEGFACRLSNDAGQYVCNNTYHHALARIAQRALPTRAVFVHLPAVEGSPLALTSASAMALGEMARGVALIARLLAEGSAAGTDGEMQVRARRRSSLPRPGDCRDCERFRETLSRRGTVPQNKGSRAMKRDAGKVLAHSLWLWIGAAAVAVFNGMAAWLQSEPLVYGALGVTGMFAMVGIGFGIWAGRTLAQEAGRTGTAVLPKV